MVQQMQGRVQPTMQIKERVAVNNDKGLEREADVMGKELKDLNGDTRESRNKKTLTRSPSSIITQFCGHPDCKDPNCKDPKRHYAVATDGSQKRFLRAGERIIGQKAVEKQIKGIQPTEEDVRVPATEQDESHAAGTESMKIFLQVRGK